jgi:hypothetical protein
MWIGLECTKNAARVFGIVECQCGSAVGRDSLSQRVELPDHRLPECQKLIGEERSAGEQQYHATGEQQHLHELLAQRLGMGIHASVPAGRRVDDFNRAQQLGADRQVGGAGGFHIHTQPYAVVLGG